MNETIKLIYALLLAHQNLEEVSYPLLDVVAEAYGGVLSERGKIKLHEILRSCRRFKYTDYDTHWEYVVTREHRKLSVTPEGIMLHVDRKVSRHRHYHDGYSYIPLGDSIDTDESYYQIIFLPDGRFNVFDHEEMTSDSYVRPACNYDDIPF